MHQPATVYIIQTEIKKKERETFHNWLKLQMKRDPGFPRKLKY